MSKCHNVGNHMSQLIWHEVEVSENFDNQGSHRLEKYLNIEGLLEKSLKIILLLKVLELL